MRHKYPAGFTLIELLVVVSIISMLISMLMPSLSRAREQGKATHCLARLSDFAKAIHAYYNSQGALPPVEYWPDKDKYPDTRHGWVEVFYGYLYRTSVPVTEDSFPVLYGLRVASTGRLADPQGYFECAGARRVNDHSGHYRVYEPFRQPRAGEAQIPELACHDAVGWMTGSLDRIPLGLPMVGDGNPRSYLGAGTPVANVDPAIFTSTIGGDHLGEADERDGVQAANWFDQRHNEAANYLFPDGHAESSRRMLADLTEDWDLNVRTKNECK